ncbi:MAG: hypothetical protein J5527_04435 [Treponema sp.]|nr:hypothetical protein [Treponema sp.]
MEVPRKVSIISTDYFDILFSEESARTAKIVADNADSLYLEAKAAYQNPHDIRIIVVISPDSDTLSVKYTASPYNRIVIYEGVPSFDEASYKNGFVELFYREIAKAVSQSVRSDFWEKVSKIIAGDSLQPVALMNMPFTFLEGVVHSELLRYSSGLLSDRRNLTLLTQMKLEGKMPSLLQMQGGMDIYPAKYPGGPEEGLFNTIAASAFCAYMQQRWGIEKFTEFWTEGGKSKFFKLNEGIFEQVYEYSLQQAWYDFVEEIPVPELEDEEQTSLFFKIDNDSVYKYLLHSQYGFIWYDDLKKEVDIYDTFSIFKNRQLLFLASEVNNLSLSSDGRYLAVSYSQAGIRENFKKDVTKLYDLKERAFLKETFELRSASVYKDKTDNTLLTAGVYIRDGYSELRVYGEDNSTTDDTTDSEPADYSFSRTFNYGIEVHSPVFLSRNKVAALVCQLNEWFVAFFDVETGEEAYVQLSYCDEVLKPYNLRRADQKSSSLLFDFVLQDDVSLTRPGMLTLDENLLPQKAIVLEDYYSGGLNDAVFYENKLYYSAHKFNFDEFRFVASEYLNYAEAKILQPEILFPSVDDEPPILSPGRKYNPWSYMFKGSWTPFMPVREITVEKGVELWPGLGVTFETQSDPFSNNQLILSAGAGFLPMEFTKLFNPSQKAREELAAKKLELSKDFAFSAYTLNTSTPADISLGGIYKFNLDGEYSFKALGGAGVEIPLRMSFRRMQLDLKGVFTSSTSYKDSHQQDFFPDLHDWPGFTDSYRNIQTVFSINYTNIHQYGISPFKKMGIEAGAVITADWDISLLEAQRRLAKDKGNVAINEQRWRGSIAPTQINAGIAGTLEIPHLTPLQNYNGWILSFPTTMRGELFYTNGTAFDVNVKILVAAKEIQNGFDTLRLYFPRFGFYVGYNFALDYDTETVVLPDLRDFTLFYDVFSGCYLNDSIYCNLLLYTTPVVGKFSVSQLISSVSFEYFLRTNEYKLSANFKIDF